MKKFRYDQKVKGAIHATVQEARKSGKSWADALKAAQLVGYNGTVPSLTKFVRPARKSTVKKAKAKSPVAAPAVTTPAVKSSSSNLDITALVHKAVTDAVVSALEGLVVRIKSGK